MEDNSNIVECPKCGGALSFSKIDEVWTCGNCGSNFSDRDILNYTARVDYSGNDLKLVVYKCPECGHELLTCADSNDTYAESQQYCPHCMHQLEMQSQEPADFQPSMILPQTLNKQQAMMALKKELGSQRFATDYYNEYDARQISCVYLPIYHVSGTATCKTPPTSIDISKHISGEGNGNVRTISINNMPITPCSDILNEEMMQMIEPFDISKASEYKPRLLSSELAELRPTGDEELKDIARQRITQGTGYSSVEEANLQVSPMMLVPVWIYKTQMEGKERKFAINAHNGKMIFTQEAPKKVPTAWLVKTTLIIIAAAELLTFIYYLIDDTI